MVSTNKTGLGIEMKAVVNYLLTGKYEDDN
jgi:hypothetical protein